MTSNPLQKEFSFQQQGISHASWLQKTNHIWLKSPLYFLFLTSNKTRNLQSTPTDPWPGKINTGLRIIESFYPFFDHNRPASFWTINDHERSHYWQGFSWMRDLKAVSDNKSRRFIRQAILGWIKAFNKPSQSQWCPELISERINNWLGFYEFFGQSSDDAFKKAFLKSMNRQFHHLRKTYHLISAPNKRIHALKCLIATNLSLNLSFKKVQEYGEQLIKTLDQCLLKDGFYFYPNAEIQLHLLRDLIDLRNYLRNFHLSFSERLQRYIEKLVPGVRLLRHGDGELSDFYGKHLSSSAMVDMILSMSDVKSRMPIKSDSAGFERLHVKNNVLITNKNTLYQHEESLGFGHFEWGLGKERMILGADLLMQNAFGQSLKLHAPSTIFRQQENEMAYIRLENESNFTRYSRQLFINDHQEIRGLDECECAEKMLLALRFFIPYKFQCRLHNDQPVALITLNNGARFRFVFSNIEDLLLEDLEPSLYFDRCHSLSALVLMPSNEKKEIKWAFYKET